MLENFEGRALNPMDRPEVCLGDGVGAIEVCDDIQRKVEFVALPLDHFLDKLADTPEGVAPSRVVRDLHGIVGTTLGGERPKMTVAHGGQLWIAKLQDRGDAPNSPLREYLAMRSARACGVDAAAVEFWRAGPHQVITVQRFDRLVCDDRRVLRHGFASAHTMLRLDSAATGVVAARGIQRHLRQRRRPSARPRRAVHRRALVALSGLRHHPVHHLRRVVSHEHHARRPHAGRALRCRRLDKGPESGSRVGLRRHPIRIAQSLHPPFKRVALGVHSRLAGQQQFASVHTAAKRARSTCRVSAARHQGHQAVNAQLSYTLLRLRLPHTPRPQSRNL